MDFLDKLTGCIEQRKTLLCVGLDPDLRKMPSGIPQTPQGVYTFLLEIIEATHDLVCAYKPNMAFFGALGLEGFMILQKVIREAGKVAPVILDAKFGDIGNTADAYAQLAFDTLGADAVTLSPYMGHDSIAPFLKYGQKFSFLLGITSNPGAALIQQTQLMSSHPLFVHVVSSFQKDFQTPNWGWVTGATRVSDMEQVRQLSPDRWFLIPGIGAQGGDLAASLNAARNPDGHCMGIVNVSRSVLYANSGSDFAMAASQVALEIVNEMRQCVSI